jgi:hypothetical protein
MTQESAIIHFSILGVGVYHLSITTPYPLTLIFEIYQKNILCLGLKEQK